MWGLQYKTGLWTTPSYIVPIFELGKTKYMPSFQTLTTWLAAPALLPIL